MYARKKEKRERKKRKKEKERELVPLINNAFEIDRGIGQFIRKNIYDRC